MIDRLLSDREVAQLIGRARSTLQKDRVSGTGIPYIYVGRQVRYRESDVVAYLAALPARRSTSEAHEADAA
jgi:predicted DNA-binding transcriptional regulator AlpA